VFKLVREDGKRHAVKVVVGCILTLKKGEQSVDQSSFSHGRVHQLRLREISQAGPDE
jgi:hypothetical protein